MKPKLTAAWGCWHKNWEAEELSKFKKESMSVEERLREQLVAAKEEMAKMRREMSGTENVEEEMKRLMEEKLAEEKEKRIEHTKEMAVRRIAKRELSKGWLGWLEPYLEEKRRKQLMKNAASRLAKPRVVASFSKWNQDWAAEEQEKATNALKAKARWGEAANSLPPMAHSGKFAQVEVRRWPIVRNAPRAENIETTAELRKWGRVQCFGTSIFIFGSFINFAAFALAAASVLAPLEAVQFITNLVFGKIVHGHTISGKMKVGSFLTAIGTIVAIACGPMSVYEFEIDDLLCFWQSPLWIAYVSFAYASATFI